MTEESGYVLRDNNEKIVKLMSLLKKQREEMNFLIEKQEMEKGRIQNEIEKLSFKLILLTKSLGQRLQARTNYDRTIKEIEQNYSNLVAESGKLLNSISIEYKQLEEIMDKKIGTAAPIQEQKSPPSVAEAYKVPPSEQSAEAPNRVEDKNQKSADVEDDFRKSADTTRTNTSNERRSSKGSDSRKLSNKSAENREKSIDSKTKTSIQSEKEKSNPKIENLKTKSQTSSVQSIESKEKSLSATKKPQSISATEQKENSRRSSSSKSAESKNTIEETKQMKWKSVSDTESVGRTPSGSMKREKSATDESSGATSADEEEEVEERVEKPKKPSSNTSSNILESFHAVRNNKATDEEVQSYREAYGRQHTNPQVPARPAKNERRKSNASS